MVISQNMVAAITYTLKSNNNEGQVLETIDSTKPVEFIFGKDSLLPSFESKLTGLESGESFEFTIPSTEAYGAFKDELIVELDKQIFAQNGVVNEQILQIGNQIPMSDSQGRRMNGIVKEVLDDKVKMDFNHPLAGQDLYFTGQVERVREATYEELNPPAHHGCGCGSGPADESCCSTPKDENTNDSCCSSEEQKSCGCGC